MLKKIHNLIANIPKSITQIVDWSATRGHLLFAVYFTGYGSWLQLQHKLDWNYIMLIGAIQAFLLGHSIKDLYFSAKNGPPDQS